MAHNNAQQSPNISLPKGGGAIKGLGETFSPDLFTGTGNFTIPIDTSPGRSDFGPKLNLNYSTGSGNGPFGLGWDISIPRITRKTEKGLPTYTDEDVFVLSGSEDLVLASDQPASTDQPTDYVIERYRPRTEGLYARIEKWTKTHGSNAGDVHWRVISKDNITNLYGKSPIARITDSNHPDRIYEWLLEETFDNKGNHILYEYQQEDQQLTINQIFEHNRRYHQTYIRRILYGNTPTTLKENQKVGHRRITTHHLKPTDSLERHYLFEVLFDYGDIGDVTALSTSSSIENNGLIHSNWPVRNDSFSSYRAGFEIRTLRLCQRILMLHHFIELEGAPLVRSTQLTYESNSHTSMSMLHEAQVFGYRKEGLGYYSESLPPLSFRYSSFEPTRQQFQSVETLGNDLPTKSLSNPEFSLVDLFGNSMIDIVQSTKEQFSYWRNLGDAVLDRRHVQHGPNPAVSLSQPGVTFADAGGDGIADLLVQNSPLTGFYESTPQGEWQNFRKFDQYPNTDIESPSARLVDLTGDGLSDLLVTHDSHFLWYRSLGKAGFDEPRHIERQYDLEVFPDVYFDDASGRVRLADITGDGLSDIVMIHDGRIDYWPNLGYGRFGKRITMANSPRFPWNVEPNRIFLVDLDGSGCTDLVYVGFDQIDFWFNQCGNSWSDKQFISCTPATTDVTSLRFSDFFGTGTTSLIWSEDYQSGSDRHYNVLDFCGHKKPHLLVEMSNNMGATTRVQFASSTKFYLADEKAGTPWATNLPMPVQVVEKTETIDHISKTKLVTIFQYHHGYFDGREREFRGFGRVDQYDTEEFQNFDRQSLHGNEVEVANSSAAYHTPTVLTKTWFHTGVYFDDDNLSPSGQYYDHSDLMEAYRHEYDQSDNDAFVLDNHELEHTDNPHEAYRALRGLKLRAEVYALDGTEKETRPFVIDDFRYLVKELQNKTIANHAVYLVIQREGMSYHYERNPQDPRINHNLLLKVNDYGQVTDSLTIAYPRRVPLLSVPEQAELIIVYLHNDYINKDDAPNFRYLNIGIQIKRYEISGAEWVFGQKHFGPQSFASILDLAITPGVFRPFHWQRPDSHIGLEKRLLEWTRAYFRSDQSTMALDITADSNGYPLRTLNNRLPLGEIESLGLPYENYTAANTDELLSEIFSEEGGVTESMMLEGGYHREPDNSGYWWLQSGQQTFDSQKFYLSETKRNAFAVDSTAVYDNYGLLAIENRDALDNSIAAMFDYRSLQPSRITDPNGNHVFSAYDVFGKAIATAAQSKTGEGDTLNGFVPELTSNQLLDFLQNPKILAVTMLNGATSRMINDPWAYLRGQSQQPAVTHPPVTATITREFHHSDQINADSSIRCIFNYWDGFNREVQAKIPAEPDPNTPQQLRWIGSGTRIYNNKGQEIKRYRPFFSDTHLFGLEQHGTSPTLFYDPLGRMICSLKSDHSYSKVVFDTWAKELWDANDTIHHQQRWDPALPNILPPLSYSPVEDPEVGHYFSRINTSEFLPTWYQRRMDDSLASTLWPEPSIRAAEQETAEKAARHAATPTTVHFDSLGRAIRQFADNGENYRFQTSVELDVDANHLSAIDSLDRVITTRKHDMLGNQLKQSGMDSGHRRLLKDVTGLPIYGWDSREYRVRHTYDKLRRPSEVFVSKNSGQEILAKRFIYGETAANAEQNNLRGSLYQVYDSVGVTTNTAFDFKKNITGTELQLLNGYKAQVDWLQSPVLESERFLASKKYDALNRAIQIIAPHSDSPGAKINFVQPNYNLANLLEGMDVWLGQNSTPQSILIGHSASFNVIENMDYNAEGLRTRITYGNNCNSEYWYDQETLRLVNLKVNRSNYPANEQLVQNLYYSYDPVGNVAHIQDNSDIHNSVFFSDQRVKPSNNYYYDPIYRLVQAQGREFVGQVNGQLKPPEPTSASDIPHVDLPHPGSGHDMDRYDEIYDYDDSGNILKISHTTTSSSWERNYEYSEPSLIESGNTNNRLSATTVNSSVESYAHDNHGNMILMPHLPEMEYNFEDQLCMTEVDTSNNASKKTYYVYDAAGNRIRKVFENVHGVKESERIYLGGFEIHRRYQQDGLTIDLERETLSVFENSRRIALVETRTQGYDSYPQELIRYQFSNHIDSASLELDQTAEVLSYEEYFPFGGTSYQALNKERLVSKRYRYTGMERDEDTGLSYHGARYYAPWLGRWTSVDPLGLIAGSNPYRYVLNNPIRFVDPSGLQEELEFAPPPPAETYGTWTDPESGEILPNTTVPGMLIVGVAPEVKGPTISAVPEPTEKELKQATGKKMRSFDASMDEIPSGNLTMYLGYGLIRSLKLGIYDPLKRVVSPKEIYYLDSSHEVRKSVIRRDVSDDGVKGLGNLALLFMPVPKTSGNFFKGFQVVEMDLATGAPKTLFGTPKRAFATYDEALVFYLERAGASSKSNPHMLEIVVSNEGKQVASWFEVSQTGGWLGHTEVMGINRIRLQPGLQVEMRGMFGPCNNSGFGCHAWMDHVAIKNGVEISYWAPGGSAYFEPWFGWNESLKGIGRFSTKATEKAAK